MNKSASYSRPLPAEAPRPGRLPVSESVRGFTQTAWTMNGEYCSVNWKIAWFTTPTPTINDQLPQQMKITITILSLLLAVAGLAQNPTRMIDEIRAHKEGTALWWAGHNSWIIKSGDIVVSTDLYLENGSRMAPPPITPEEIAGKVLAHKGIHRHMY